MEMPNFGPDCARCKLVDDPNVLIMCKALNQFHSAGLYDLQTSAPEKNRFLLLYMGLVDALKEYLGVGILCEEIETKNIGRWLR